MPPINQHNDALLEFSGSRHSALQVALQVWLMMQPSTGRQPNSQNDCKIAQQRTCCARATVTQLVDNSMTWQADNQGVEEQCVAAQRPSGPKQCCCDSNTYVTTICHDICHYQLSPHTPSAYCVARVAARQPQGSYAAQLGQCTAGTERPPARKQRMVHASKLLRAQASTHLRPTAALAALPCGPHTTSPTAVQQGAVGSDC